LGEKIEILQKKLEGQRGKRRGLYLE